ncbi:hypothetical protein VM1G_11972 [Cytospora mali]|uniref:C2H2-type domain-containing protein n=1 Tax=Cytospora mali TaxID=578113 RepID=A0A194WDR4_CYTMA|nr:hypothetical protein VM1G_11972 [Valsa mali]
MAQPRTTLGLSLFSDIPHPNRLPQLTRRHQHSPDWAQDDIFRDEAEEHWSEDDPTIADDCSQRSNEGCQNLEDICRAALRLAEELAAHNKKETPSRTWMNGHEKCKFHRCMVCHRRFHRYNELQRHVHTSHAKDAGLPGGCKQPEGLIGKCIKSRFRSLRALGSRRPLMNPLGLPESEQKIRREEAEGERCYFSRHVGVRFLDGLQDDGSKSSDPLSPVSTDRRNFGRVVEAMNQPKYLHRDWISQRELSDRGLWHKGMYQDLYRHVHDQLYFIDEVGNKMWLVDDEGQAVLAQDQKL